MVECYLARVQAECFMIKIQAGGGRGPCLGAAALQVAARALRGGQAGVVVLVGLVRVLHGLQVLRRQPLALPRGRGSEGRGVGAYLRISLFCACTCWGAQGVSPAWSWRILALQCIFAAHTVDSQRNMLDWDRMMNKGHTDLLEHHANCIVHLST